MVGGTIIFTVVIIAVSTIIPIALMIGIFVFIARKNAERQQLVATGIPAQGMIVQMGDTGIRINDQPQLSLVIDVHPIQGYAAPFAPFRTTLNATIPMMAMARISPGVAVPVKVDPANPARLAIDWAAMGFVI
jgi:hypothetical protein